jgi:hypothetical protein
METRPDDIDRTEELEETGFGEHEEEAQEAEWEEDAEEGGS